MRNRVDDLFRTVDALIERTSRRINNRTAELAASVFGCGVRVGSLVPEIEGLESHPHPAACAVVAGLLLLAQRQNEPEPSFFASIKNLFGRSK